MGTRLEPSPYEGWLATGWTDGPPDHEGHPRSLEVGLLCPSTFMNRSGRAVAALLAARPSLDPAGDVLVVYDDLDLPFGRLRLRPAGGAGGHNGLADVIAAVGSDQVPRLRLGIGRPPGGRDPVEYVLSPFEGEEADALPGFVARSADAVSTALRCPIGEAMTEINRAPAPVES